MTAVMGPSGAGKTTFLNTLSGKAYYGVSFTGESLEWTVSFEELKLKFLLSYEIFHLCWNCCLGA